MNKSNQDIISDLISPKRESGKNGDLIHFAMRDKNLSPQRQEVRPGTQTCSLDKTNQMLYDQTATNHHLNMELPGNELDIHHGREAMQRTSNLSSHMGGDGNLASDIPTNIKILSWNLAGIGNKIDDGEWGAFIDTSDICLFQETWCTLPIHRNGFTCFHVSAVKQGRGRPSGGLATLIKTSLQGEIKQIPIASHDILPLTLKLASGRQLLICNVYSRGGPPSQDSPVLADLDLFLTLHNPRADIMVAGDLNITFEPLNAFPIDVVGDEDSEWGIPCLDLAPVRWSTRAAQILGLTYRWDLRAVNGRTKADRLGAHTYNRIGHTSCIDTFFCTFLFG